MKTEVKADLTNKIIALSGQAVMECYQCKKCTSGCPSATFMDYPPDEMIFLVYMNRTDELLKSPGIWKCVQCYTCGLRCPNKIDTGKVIDAVKNYIASNKIKVPYRKSYQFHSLFLKIIEVFGRIHELSLLALFKLLTLNFTDDIDIGIKLFIRGKLRILPERIQNLMIKNLLKNYKAPGKEKEIK